MTTVRPVTSADKNSWNEFCACQGLSNHAWQFEWLNIISKSFGHTPFYLIAETDGKVSGILPLFLVKSLLFGKALISVPYLNGGGIIAQDTESYQLLFEQAHSLATVHQVKYLELRNRESVSFSTPELKARTHKVAMLLPLTSNPDDIFKRFSAKLRSQIRRPTKSGVTSKLYSGLDTTGVNDFYSVFSTNMRDLGTPVYPKQFIQNIACEFGDNAHFAVAYLGNQPLAAGLSIKTSSYCEILLGSSLRSANNVSPNMLMYWELIQAACQKNCLYFDFGRTTPGSGTYKFKEQWGTVPAQLYWYYLADENKIPDINPKSKKFSLLVSLWKTLPRPVANTFGPWLTRSLP